VGKACLEQACAPCPWLQVRDASKFFAQLSATFEADVLAAPGIRLPHEVLQASALAFDLERIWCSEPSVVQGAVDSSWWAETLKACAVLPPPPPEAFGV